MEAARPWVGGGDGRCGEAYELVVPADGARGDEPELERAVQARGGDLGGAGRGGERDDRGGRPLDRAAAAAVDAELIHGPAARCDGGAGDPGVLEGSEGGLYLSMPRCRGSGAAQGGRVGGARERRLTAR